MRSSEWCGFQECFVHYSTLPTSLKSCHFDLDSNFQFTTDAQTIVKMNLTASGLGLAADCRVDLFPRRPDVEFCGHALVSLRLGYTSVKLKSMSLCQRCYCIAKVCRRWAGKTSHLSIFDIQPQYIKNCIVAYQKECSEADFTFC